MSRSFKRCARTGRLGPYSPPRNWSRERKTIIDNILKFVNGGECSGIMARSQSNEAVRLTSQLLSYTSEPHFPDKFSFSKLKRAVFLIRQIRRIEEDRRRLMDKERKEFKDWAFNDQAETDDEEDDATNADSDEFENKSEKDDDADAMDVL